MCCAVVDRNIVVQPRIDGTGTGSKRNGKENEGDQIRRERKAKQSHRGECRTDCRYTPRAIAVDQTGGGEAGEDGKEREQRREISGDMNTESEVHVHCRPCGAKKRIGNPQSDVGNVDDKQKQYGHNEPFRSRIHLLYAPVHTVSICLREKSARHGK